MIEAEEIVFSYEYTGSKKRALDGASMTVHSGELAAVLGRNGCGKSTLCKHFNALLELQQGELTVAGINVAGETDVWKLRRQVGMVFQNPDNQFVSSVIEEDVAFGLENYEVPREEIAERVAAALRQVGMGGFEKRAPHTLSGGQKQRAALAGVLALDPDILVFDEATAMLDPEGRREVLEVIRRLHDSGKTIVMITHYIEEAVFADRVYLMSGGRILACGTPREMLTDPALLARAGLTPPTAVKLYFDLKADGIELPFCPLTNEELAGELCRFQQKTSR